MTTVPPFTAASHHSDIVRFTAAAKDILSRGQLTLGPYTERFERQVAAMAGTEHAVAVSTGSTALEILFRYLQVAGREVLVPTNTNFATAAAALRAGARVQLYDSGLYPNLGDLTARLSGEVAAVVVVHIGGYITPQMPQLNALCSTLGVPLIEDAAHAHGSQLDVHRRAGSFGLAAAWSFFATKVVTTAGEGGALTTNDPALAEAARRYRNQGKDPVGRHVVMGNSWRMPEINAAAGGVQIAHLAEDIQARRRILDTYADTLPATGLELPALPREVQVSGHKAIATLPGWVDRSALSRLMAAGGVELAREVYELPLHRQPVFTDPDIDIHTDGEFPIADTFAASHICLPLWQHMTDSQVHAVTSTAVSAMNRLTRG